MIGRKTSLSLANAVVSVFLGLLAMKLAALYLGPGPIGQATAALGFLGLAFFVTDLGMGSAHVKRVSEGQHEGDCFATFAVFKIASTSLFVVGALGVLYVYLVPLGRPLITTTVPIFFVILVYYVAKSLQEVGQASFEARLETAKQQVAAFSDTLVRVLLTIAAALVVGAVVHQSGPLAGRVEGIAWLAWLGMRPGLSFALATAAGGIAAAMVSLSLLARVRSAGRFRWDLFRGYVTFALPLFLSSALGVIAMRVDFATLAFFLDATETGIYGAVQRLPQVLSVVPLAVGALLFPTISGLAARGDHDAISSKMDRAVRYLSMLSVPMVAFAVVFAGPLIHIALSDEFLPGTRVLGLLALHAFVTTLAMPHATLLMGTDRPGIVAKIGIATALSVIVFDLIFVPYDIRALGIPLFGLGATGAALGTLLSGLIWYTGLRIASWRLVGYRERGHIWKHALAAALMSAALWSLHTGVLPLERWYHILVYAVAGGLAYFLGLLLLREFTREDWRYLRESVHPIEMMRYVRDELFPRR